MHMGRMRIGKRWGGWRALFACVAIVTACGVPIRARFDSRTSAAIDGLVLAGVRRIDLEEVVTVGGTIGGNKQTVIYCDLENLSGRGFGGGTIIQLVPNGSHVKKGDMLCRFDASTYEEEARQAELDLQRANSEFRTAELDLQSAQIGLRSYRDGESIQVQNENRGKIALAKSDLEKSREHLIWTQQMMKIGYVPSRQVADEVSGVLMQQNTLSTSERALSNLIRFTVPKTLTQLDGKVITQREQLAFATMQKTNCEERLEHFRDLVKKCTIVAPHDGMVVHADVAYDEEEWALRPGSIVYEGQPLFFLPDLSRLLADVSLHESIAAQVRPGMKATVRVPSRPDRWIEAKVEHVNQLPEQNWLAGVDVQHFPASVALLDSPPWVSTGKSAEVRIVTGIRRNILVLPVEAVSYIDDHATCRVVAGSRIERRAITVQRADMNLLEVVSGLSEGDSVVVGDAAESAP